MTYKFLLISTILFFFSCKKEVEIIGHWHIYNLDFPEREYFTLNIVNDSIASHSKNSFNGEEFGSHNVTKKEIDLPGECRFGLFKYKIRNNNIFLKGRHLNGNFKGIKCNLKCCTRIEDYFKDILLDIKLTTDSSNTGIELSLSSCANIFIGKAKEYLRNDYGNTVRIQLGDKFANLSDLHFFTKKHEFYSEKNNISTINYVIYYDHKTNLDTLSNVISTLKNLTVDSIFIANKKENLMEGENPFTFRHVE